MTTVTEVWTKALVPSDLLLKSTTIKVEEEETSNVDLQDIPLPPPSTRPTEVLSIDKNTPDNHVPRDPRLLRLTGVHPFNVEPPLTDLYKEGIEPFYSHVFLHGEPYPLLKNIDQSCLRLKRVPNLTGTLLCQKPWSGSFREG